MPDTPLAAYDAWLRTRFTDLNTALEEAYFAAGDDQITGHDDAKDAILREGAALIAAIGDIPHDDTDRYKLLGAVGFHLAACARHGVGDPVLLAPAWALARLLGSALDVAPRFVFSHQSLYNTAVGDRIHTFTTLPDEKLFIVRNGEAVLAYRRAAHALSAIGAMGMSNPMAAYLFEDAAAALGDVLRFSQALARDLDTERFYLNIRPYFTPHAVGRAEFRGVNAGDFAAINVVDLLLGLCSPSDPFYQEVLAEKRPYLPPGDGAEIQAALTTPSLLDRFIAEASVDVTFGLRRNIELYLAVCRAHGAAYAFHHHRLVADFIEKPAAARPGAAGSSSG
ncbi:MAG TPA: monodechloroaminopyrrolnitrin synthase PrnB family protein, partial [Phytomonospora sp.]